jgi:cbb3-type cytochrome oxidase maturation protein
MLYFGWIILVGISLWVSLMAFVWALRSGQFDDQERARYLPLTDESPLALIRQPRKSSAQSYALMMVAGLGVAGLLGAVILSLFRLK